jgi:hypothetical protein
MFQRSGGSSDIMANQEAETHRAIQIWIILVFFRRKSIDERGAAKTRHTRHSHLGLLSAIITRSTVALGH